MNRSKQESQFKQVLLEAVDEGMLAIGESGKEAAYFHLQSLCSLKREEIPEKPEVFVEGLQKIFGLGAEVIERAIVKRLYLKLGLEFTEKKGYSFLEYLNDAKHLNK